MNRFGDFTLGKKVGLDLQKLSIKLAKSKFPHLIDDKIISYIGNPNGKTPPNTNVRILHLKSDTYAKEIKDRLNMPFAKKYVEKYL